MSRRAVPFVIAAFALVVAALVLRTSPRAPRDASAAGGVDEREERDDRAAAAHAATPSPFARGPRSASIGGRVTLASGDPVARAQVCTSPSSDRLVTADRHEPRCTATDAEGRYRLGDLPPARYAVSASAPRFSPTRFRDPARGVEEIALGDGERKDGVDLVLAEAAVLAHGVVTDQSGGTISGATVIVSAVRPTATGHVVTKTSPSGAFEAWVAEGAVRVQALADGYADGAATGVAPGQRIEIALTPESVLAGRVVVAGSGEPVPFARVDASAPAEKAGESDAPSALTDEDGAFRIRGLPPGRYKPIAIAAGARGAARESVRFGLADSAADVVIEVHAAFALAGRIEQADGTPCARGWTTLLEKASKEPHDAMSDEKGRVRFEALFPGEYEVRVACSGNAETKQPAVALKSADVTNLVWRVESGTTVSGVVVDSAGKRVPHAAVDARPIGGALGWGHAESEDDGTFRLRGLTPASYRFSARRAGMASPKEPLLVDATKDVTGVEIVLPAAGAITGVVVDDADKPVRRISVRLHTERWTDLSTTTRDDGTFRFDGLLPRDYHVRAEREWRAVRAPGTKDGDVQGASVDVRAGETAKVKLVVESRDGEITGKVIDETGEPVADAFVEAELEPDDAGPAAGRARRTMHWRDRWGHEASSAVVAGVDGEFVLRELSPGSYTVRAFRKGGGEALAEAVAVGSRIKLQIVRHATLRGTVTGSPQPQRFTIVATDDQSGVTREETFFRTGGAFALGELPGGTYRVSANADGARGVVTVSLGEGETKPDVRIALEPSATVHGRVVDLETGAPVAGLFVLVTPHGELSPASFNALRSEDRRFVTDADGRYTVTGVSPGKALVNVWEPSADPSYAFVWYPVNLAPGRDNEVPVLRAAKMRTKGALAGDLGVTWRENRPGMEPEEMRYVVTAVRPGGPAERAGVVAGDQVVTVDGHGVSRENAYLFWALARVPEGRTIALGLARGATVSVRAGKPR